MLFSHGILLGINQPKWMFMSVKQSGLIYKQHSCFTLYEKHIWSARLFSFSDQALKLWFVWSYSFVPGSTLHFSAVSSQVFKEEKYLKEAAECGEVIWQRGLLRKGYGICHGTAGNGYAFLSLYKLTQEKKYLYRACKVRSQQQTCYLRSVQHLIYQTWSKSKVGKETLDLC